MFYATPYFADFGIYRNRRKTDMIFPSIVVMPFPVNVKNRGSENGSHIGLNYPKSAQNTLYGGGLKNIKTFA
jgi:hypothetical protein